MSWARVRAYSVTRRLPDGAVVTAHCIQLLFWPMPGDDQWRFGLTLTLTHDKGGGR